MKTFGEDAPFPMGRLVAGTMAVFLLVGLVLFWFSDQEAGKKADALYHLAEDALKARNLETAHNDIDNALKMKEQPRYLKTKLDILMAQDKLFEAEEAAARLLVLTPNDPVAQSSAAVLAYNQGKMDRAETYYKAAIRLEPDNADYRIRLADLLAGQGKADEAKTLFEGVVQKDPRFKFGWEQYVTVLINGNTPDRAVEVAKRALASIPDDSDLTFLLASAYDAAHQKQNAVAAYRRSLEIQPMADSLAARRIFELTGEKVPPKLESMESERIELETERGLMFTQAFVNGVQGRFLLDTGASVSVVFQGRMKKYHVRPSPLKMEVQTGGGLVQTSLGMADIRLGRQELPQLRLALLPDLPRLHSDGIIGMDFLGKFKMDLDRDNHVLTLSR